jgi:hypothetical protein
LAALYGLAMGPLPKGFLFGDEKKKKKDDDESSKGPIFSLLKPPSELNQLDIVWSIAVECQN